MNDIGRYRIIRQLGTGGMGFVYLAHDPTLERDVALKLLHLAKQVDLLTEAKTLASLSHPNIVTIFEIGAHEGQDFLTMEYLPGRTLREVMRAHAPREVLLAICGKVASALLAAHRAKILHRDIKPENVVVSDAGDVKVVDFGIARRFDAAPTGGPRAMSASDVVEALRRTSPPTLLMWGPDTEVSAGTQTAFGTPAYMAPEVLLGDASNEASDVYSLGVVLYECLAGRRPHAASTLVEVIAQMIDEDPPPIDDPLGPLVARMLLRARAERPALPEVLAALERACTPRRATPVPTRASLPTPPLPPPTPSSGRLPALIALGAVAAAGLAAGAWALLRAPATPPAPAAVAAPVTATIAVEPLRIDIPSYGAEPPKAAHVTATLAKLVEEIDGAKLATVMADPAGAAVATRYALRGSLVERGAVVEGTLELRDGATDATLATLTATRPSGELAPLLDALVGQLAHAISPAATLAPPPNPVRARTFARIGAPLLQNARFTDARPYYEQAVDADPAYFDGWYALANVLAWMQAPDARVLDATDRALALAPPGPEHELVRGMSLVLRGEFGAGRAVLEPLEHATPPLANQRDLLYYLGEASWHDGRHAAGFAYFKRALELDLQFRPATVHAWEYPTARRDAEASQYYIGLAGESPAWRELALGHYADVADHGDHLFKLAAQLVLGREPTPDVAPTGDDLDARTYRVARALEAGDAAGARRELDSLWTMLAAVPPAQALGMQYSLEILGEVLVCAELAPDVRRLVAILAAQSSEHPARGYHRLAILAAPVLGDAALVVRTKLTERETRLAAASDAELAGDHAQAVAILGELVADPSFAWEYPERAALIRNLRALRRTKEAAAVCSDTMRPAIFHTAFLVLRRTCAKK